MSEAEVVLTREELAAILADPKLHAEREGVAIAASRRPRPFSRALVAFAEDQSRLAATVHQRPIRFELLRTGSTPVGEFAALLAAEDRAFALRMPEMRGAGAVVVGRSLLYSWLVMAFGAPPELDVPLPDRGYTRIELRFLRRLVGEIVAQLERSLDGMLPARLEIGEMIEPELVPDFVAPRLHAAAFDVVGLGEPGRLRIAVPEAWLDRIEQAVATPGERDTVHSEQLLDVPVDVCAEAGRAELSLRRIGSLAVGDEIPLVAPPDGAIVVHVAGKPRFTAIRGRAGTRAAIQIVSD